MNTYLLLFIISTVSSLILTPLLRRLCERMGWLDVPRDERKIHLKAVPRLGGVAIFASIIVSLCALFFVENDLTRALRANGLHSIIVLSPAILVLVLGIYDDFKGTNARVKLVALTLTGSLFYFMGGRIEAISVPFVGSLPLPAAVGFVLTVLWVAGIANAFNLIDGMDGLASGAALFSSLVILAISLIYGNPLGTVVALVLTGALIGFLRYNFNPASIFLGDSGALFIGFTLAALSVLGTQKASTAIAVAIPILAFGLPVFDTGFSMVRRLISGKPVFEGDREHVHHMLLARGWSQRRVALTLYGVCAIFGLMALIFVSANQNRAGLILFVVGAAIILGINQLRYHEVDEFKAGVMSNLTDRRSRIANNIRVRRASRTLSSASTLGELFTAMQDVLESGEFVYASVQLGRGGDDARNETALMREKDSPALRGSEIRSGLICWSWARGDVDAAEVPGSGSFWSLRLPLTTDEAGWGYLTLYREFSEEHLLLDVSYLCNLLRKEMSHAAARILESVRVDDEAREEYATGADRMLVASAK
ncbi:MAG TPA: MraY family glycosyltransferase [Pyrinomonadaceae bacterium]|nr:MraY family glycosyltransferase [Pyrinomonadaceae bacterium]